MEFVQYGCYIIEPCSKPEYISLTSEYVVSASSCICDHHPSLEHAFWVESEQKQPRYRELLQLSSAEFTAMQTRIAELFDMQTLDVDCCFTHSSDALEFMQKYLCNLSHLKAISLAFKSEYEKQLLEELENSSGNPSHLFSGKPVSGKLLGYEILGWDYSGFHSFLCNGLERDILKTKSLVVDQCSLIQNPYSEVQKFCEMMQGQGEPVLWMPFAVYQIA